MHSSRLNVQVLETPADGEGFFPARELLPWADPYIAALMGRLEDDTIEVEEDDELADPTWDFDYEPLDEEDETGLGEQPFLQTDGPEPDDWHLDREPAVPPVYGGWPLLNDLSPTR